MLQLFDLYDKLGLRRSFILCASLTLRTADDQEALEQRLKEADTRFMNFSILNVDAVDRLCWVNVPKDNRSDLKSTARNFAACIMSSGKVLSCCVHGPGGIFVEADEGTFG